jgi:four helix bundle protein
MAVLKHNFRELKIWRMSMDIVKSVYMLTDQLPNAEKYGIVSQLNRASISIPSNIAEGSGRSSQKQFTYFLDVALSSSFELETQLILVSEIFELNVDELINNIHELQKMIVGFRKSLDAKV